MMSAFQDKTFRTRAFRIAAFLVGAMIDFLFLQLVMFLQRVESVTMGHYILLVLFSLVFADFVNELVVQFRLFGLDIDETEMRAGEDGDESTIIRGKQKVYTSLFFCLIIL